jgi:hypothetical protein
MYLLLTKRKSILLATIFLIVLSLISCNNQKVSKAEKDEKTGKTENVELEGKIISSVTIAKIGESLRDIKKPHISYHPEKITELQTFANAIKQAKETDGIVDIGKADYLLTFTFTDKTHSKYSLWLGTDSGSVMNLNNSYKMYILPANSITDLNKYVK